MSRALAAARLLALGIALVPVASCSDAVAPRESCPDEQVTAAVSAGARPLLSWSPACGMAALTVFPVDMSMNTGWALYSDVDIAENPLPSGIRFGQAPNVTGVIDTEDRPLIRGKLYRLTLYRGYGNSRAVAGEVEFTP
jgi:hypothetical protein